jgi:1-acyl-sn-glycerol-3-phosphate acyltransferase
MIEHNRSNWAQALLAPYVAYRIRRAFNVFQHTSVEVKPGHSVLLLCNHFSWWDGIWAGHLAYRHLGRRFHIMMQEDHLKQRPYFRHVGGFSINPKSREVVQSLNYTAELLGNPANLVTMFPQGELVSNHAADIHIEKGVAHIIKKVKGNCQIIYYTALIDYFESLKPSVYLHLLDCGTNHDFNFEHLQAKINAFHQQALKDQVKVAH